ncbi:unannotated protein [freshwater metagenome]|uniref:Unannotated protein n=1 Tax=freshwater metagenome TaxID=449393 RepID=A0A6J6SJ23_9ZZZZ
MRNARLYIALLTPMARTLSARDANSSRSRLWRPNNLTTRAPDTLNRSVICVFMAELRSMP